MIPFRHLAIIMALVMSRGLSCLLVRLVCCISLYHNLCNTTTRFHYLVDLPSDRAPVVCPYQCASYKTGFVWHRVMPSSSPAFPWFRAKYRCLTGWLYNGRIVCRTLMRACRLEMTRRSNIFMAIVMPVNRVSGALVTIINRIMPLVHQILIEHNVQTSRLATIDFLFLHFGQSSVHRLRASRKETNIRQSVTTVCFGCRVV